MEENQKPKFWSRYLRNKYIWILLFFIVWMLFLDNYSLLNHLVLNKQIDELERNKKFYREEINKDVQNLKLLKNPDQVEKFARERYLMKKDSEDVYLIEYVIDSGSTK
jgi:cell division protein FtsB